MRVFVASILCSLLWLGGAFAFCAGQQVQLLDSNAKVQFSTEIALTPDEQAQGLMHREDLPQFSAMLFVNDGEALRSFWMKNTLIALDILFFDKDGHLVNVAQNAKPHDLSPQRSTAPAQYVLEINGGLFKRLRLTDSVRLNINTALFSDNFSACRAGD